MTPVYVWVGRRRERLVLDDTCLCLGRKKKKKGRLVLDDTCSCLGRKKKNGKVSIR